MTGGFTLWLTGLSGSGKTTHALSVGEALRKRGVTRLEILDGDVIRRHLTKGLGFSREDRDANVRRIAYIAELLTRNGVVVIVAAISSYREAREHARKCISSFIEVCVKCPLSVLVQRDPKGLYQKALAGEIGNFTGVSDAYEEPLNPQITVQTDQDSIDQGTRSIVSLIQSLGYI